MHHPATPQALPIHTPGAILAKILALALTGFLVLVMFGPVVAVLSAVVSVILSVAAVVLGIGIALLPFALIGLLVLGIYQAAGPGQEATRQAFRQRLKDFARTFGRFVTTTCRRAYLATLWSARKGWGALALAGRGVRRSMQAIRQATAGRGRAAARMGLEMGCGALLATGLCLALTDGAPGSIPIGIVGGVILGAAIGMSRPEKRVLPG
jgi:hypothetical protein